MSMPGRPKGEHRSAQHEGTPVNTRTPPNDVQILVVDDEPDLRTLYELALVREGYAVVGVGNLGEARELLARQRFDVVVTDMRLPDGLGTSLLHLCRDQHRTERCVVITAYGSAENAVESLKTGAFDYLTKPVDVQQFRAVVASAGAVARRLTSAAFYGAAGIGQLVRPIQRAVSRSFKACRLG